MRSFCLPACLLASTLLLLTGLVVAAEPERDHATYVPKTKYPVLEEMKERDKKLEEAAKKKTEEILEKIKAEEKEKKKQARELRFDVSGIERPESPAAFDRVWHFPPTPQYRTGTCWSFSVTSFMESEIHRLHGKQIKLSEMWTAYWEYVEKARGWIARRGKSEFSQGSESNAIQHIWTQYGIVPRDAYEGTLAEDGRFDHARMAKAMKSFLEWCRQQNYWNEEVILTSIRAILDDRMGRPPETVSWEGGSYTPREFLSEVCRLDVSDYVSLMSTLKEPFWSRAEYKVPDNWWHDKSYVNVPLETWYDVILSAVNRGYSLAIGGDVSEPGLYGKRDLAVIPSFDIPSELIDQDSRELRISNKTTGDDHGIHLVGHTRTADGHDWFLIKDSNRSSRLGQFKGYYMYRDDYVRLKMLTITVHRDLVEPILRKVEEQEKERAVSDKTRQTGEDPPPGNS